MRTQISQAMQSLTGQAGQIGVSLATEHLVLLTDYCQQLSEYNAHTNLVSKSEPDVLVKEHLLDSLTLVPIIEGFRARIKASGGDCRVSLIDIGSGAGLPGLILAVVVPDLKVTLVEAIGKKARFLEEAAANLNLADRVNVLAERAEELSRQAQYRQSFDLATARAVGAFDMVSELALPLLRLHGQLLLQKSIAQLEADLKTAVRVLPKLGGRIIETTALDQRVLGKERAIITVEKVADTPDKYPRPWAKIKAQPLGGVQ